MDVLEELILCITAIDDVEPAGLQGGTQLLLFVTVAVGHTGMARYAFEDIEMQVHLGGAMLLVEPQSPGHLRQGGQQAAVHGGQAAQDFGLLAGVQRQGFLGEFADDALQGFGIEGTGRRAERPQGGTGAVEFVLDLFHATGLLQAAQAGESRVEEEEQDQGGILIVMELAIAGGIDADVMQRCEQGLKSLEILQALDVLGRDGRFSCAWHERTVEQWLSKWPKRNLIGRIQDIQLLSCQIGQKRRGKGAKKSR